MKFRKTSSNNRGIYTYHFADGQTLILEQGVNGVTELDIKNLHSMDDSEVYFNIKNCRPSISDEKKLAIKEWNEKYPDNKHVSNSWNMSLDDILDSNDDPYKRRILTQIEYSSNNNESNEIERLHEVVSTLTEEQQKIYRLVFIENIPMSQVAIKRGVTEGAVRKTVNKIKNKILNDEILKNFFNRGTN